MGRLVKAPRKAAPMLDLDESQDDGARKSYEQLSAAFDKGKRDASASPAKDTSPVKEKLAKMRKMMDEPGQSTGSASSSNPVLEAIEALSHKMDNMAVNMATKSDVDKVSTDLMKHTKVMIAEAVDPIKAEMYDMKCRLDNYDKHKRGDSARTQTSSSQHPGLDPALKQIAFIGFPDSISAADRLRQVERFLAENAKDFRAVAVDNIYNGPYTDRKLTKATYAEFASPDSRREALNCLSGKTLSVGGQNITFKNARTKFNGQRNYSLRKAEQVIKGSTQSSGKSVKINWTERSVTVDGSPAFTQDKTETGGSFVSPYADLTLG